MTPPADLPRRRPRAAAAVLIVAVVAALGVLTGVAVFLNMGGDEKAADKRDGEVDASGRQVVSLNQAARDGSLSFTVTAFDCGGNTLESTAASASATASPGGRFCVADVTVKNVSKTGQRFQDTAQILVDAAGARRTPHAEALAVLNPAGAQAYASVAAGKDVRVRLPWDVPSSAAPVAIELHADTSSPGVTVNFPYAEPTGSPAPATPSPPPSPTPSPAPTADPIATLPPGLFCRDLLPRGISYADAVRYWEREGRPGRMDADENGVPCETVYPPESRG